MTIEPEDNNEKSSTMLIALAVTGFIAVILALAWYGIPQIYNQPNNSGEFGDMFGGVNALFSGLAFLGVIIAIMLQKEELSYQRKELEATRCELKQQRKQMEIQNTTFRQQRFDSTFFQMLSLHNEIVTTITTGLCEDVGRECFSYFYSNLRSHAKGCESIDDVQSAFDALIRKIESSVGHYFRNLHNIIKFVDASDIDDKQFYANIIRAQLSSDELTILFYNCVTDPGREEFMPLVERYDLLKHSPKDEFLHPSHASWYKPEC